MIGNWNSVYWVFMYGNNKKKWLNVDGKRDQAYAFYWMLE